MEDTKDNFKEAYSKYTFRKILIILVCIVLAVVFFFYSLTVGTLQLTMADVYDIFIKHLNGATYDKYSQWELWYEDHIIWEYRVPRALLGLICGIALAIAGTTMQSVMKNPLADPYTTGVSSGALFGVAIAIVLGFSTGLGSESMGLVANAIIFAMIPVVVIIVMAPFFRKSPSTLILSGIAVSYLFNSLTSLLLIITDAESLKEVYSWQIGSLVDRTWDSVPMTAAVTLAGSIVLLLLSNKMNLMSLDDKDAKSLGLNSNVMRVICLFVLAFMAAVVVANLGIIGFVGLVIPHIARMILGSDNKFLIPASAAIGAVFLLGCDIVARLLPVVASVPVGVITSFIGSPIFIILIIRQKGGVW
ncbi:MAG: iron ABC transporter permease [Candidatus Methanomethylophilus sp.]|nr:iron ABC transporter permease [Methanomethylophilus sp.]